MKMNKRNLTRIAVYALIACLTVFTIGLTVSAETTISQSYADPSPAAYVAQKNTNSVVGVLTYADTWDRHVGVQSTNTSQGSGVVIREGGYVLTNNHVIEGGSSFKLLMPNGEKADATLVGADSALDLAVLKVTDEFASQLTPVEIGASSQLLVGSTVIAIGNPGGEVLANTVTQGIVSALERSSVSASNATRSVAYIQHDAAINSGNSGGGLFNYLGQLVGINTLKYSGSVYSSVTFEGLGFAIPVETAVDIANDLIDYGKVIRPALGVSVAAYNGPDEPLNEFPPASICIYGLNEGGAAEQAGLKTYDFIYKINGVRVTTLMELTSQLDLHNPGDTVDVTVIRYRNASMATQNYGDYGNYFYGYPFGGSQPDQEQNSSSIQTGEVYVSGGYEEVTVKVTLEELQ